MVRSRFDTGSFMSSRRTAFTGCFLIVIGSLFLPRFLFAAVISKLLPPSDKPAIAVQSDWYYSFLVPLTLCVLSFGLAARCMFPLAQGNTAVQRLLWEDN